MSQDPQGSAVAPAAAADAPDTQILGRHLKIRSMVNMAAEVLPFFWPMRNFIHHNPLHGLEHLPFAEAVERATALFHAQGYLPRAQYQQLLRDGAIDPVVIEELVDEFVADWLQAQGRPGDDPLGQRLQAALVKLMTASSQPRPGAAEPGADAIVLALRRLAAERAAASEAAGGEAAR